MHNHKLIAPVSSYTFQTITSFHSTFRRDMNNANLQCDDGWLASTEVAAKKKKENSSHDNNIHNASVTNTRTHDIRSVPNDLIHG